MTDRFRTSSLTFLLIVLAVAAMALPSALAQTLADKPIVVDPGAAASYNRLSSEVSSANLASTVDALSSIKYDIPQPAGAPPVVAYSRIAGTPGGETAREFVRGRFQQIFGAQNVVDEPFDASVPIDHGAFLRDSTRSYALRPMWPNLVRTSTLPEGGIDGPLIYAGDGDVRAYRGKVVEGSIVLLDFNCGTQWLNAPRLGARAVIFIEPENTSRGEAESKFIGIPISVPRFWISRGDAALLQSAALTRPNYSVHLECFQPWERHPTSNIIGILPGSDPVLSKQVIIIESYYDSMSVVPSLAPGAESSCGMASLLELARIFKANPPKRTVWFVACGAHFLGLQGARTYVDNHLESWQDASAWEKMAHWASFGHSQLPGGRQDVRLFTGLDLSTNTNQVGVFYKGYFYDYREDIAGSFSDIGRALRDNAAKIGQTLGFDSTQEFADAINGVNGKTWRNFLPGHFAFDAEAASLAGGKGITFATVNDGRLICDTPEDTPDKVNIANLAAQTKLLACEYWDLLNDTDDPNTLPPDSPKGVMPVSEWQPWTRQGLQLGFCDMSGRVLEFDPIKSFVPDKPIINSLAVVTNPSKTMVGVRGNLIQQANTLPGSSTPDARYDFVGLPMIIAQPKGLVTVLGNYTDLEAFHLADKAEPEGNRGDIDYSLDQQSYYNPYITMLVPQKQIDVVVFGCVATAIYDLVDQKTLKIFDGVNVLDGASNSNPHQYGFLLPQAEPGQSYAEDVAVLFSIPGPTTRLKVIMTAVEDQCFLLINSEPPNPKLSNEENQRNAEGLGYAVGVASAINSSYTTRPDPNDPNDVVRNGSITDTAYRVARDMWNLDDFRINQLAQFRIVDDNLHNTKGTGLHDLAGQAIQQAYAAYQARDYSGFDTYSREAWGYESRVYPQVQETANDVIHGVIFYLFLLIPFSFFLERLLIAAPDLKSQLSWAFGIFVIIFILFAQIHPAFKITVNPIIILVAFMMLAMSVFVSLLIWNKFEEQLHAISRSVTGVHKAEVGKASVAFAAFSLGISNMRRRKERTLLTCITLILLTFTILSFTSIVTGIKLNDVSAPGTSLYNGILLHMPDWTPLQEPAYQILSDEYGNRFPVAPRAWYFGSQQGQQTFLSVERAQLSTDIKGIVGMTPQEAQVSHIDNTLLSGRWLNASDTYNVVIPKQIADNLDIALADAGRTNIVFAGIPYKVVGIYDQNKFNSVNDLDDETLSPVDFQTSSQQQQLSTGTPGGSMAGFQKYTHLDSAGIIIAPYATVMNMGGGLRSIAVNFGTAATTHSELEDLIKRLDLNLYAGENGQNHRFSAISATQSKDLQDVIVPLILAALIVFTTMLNSVYERVKEIAIFSSIGLSPANIAMLFIAEALVYGVIGSVSGYLIGQTLSKVISAFNILPGLYLNFSSTSAELSIFMVIAVVLLSTIYPARKASEVATPAVDRVWRVPDPDGDEWNIALPFAVTSVQAAGVTNFLAEWFSSYEEQSVGEFLTDDVRTGLVDSELGEGHGLTTRVWLAPFDLGVSQDVFLKIVPTDLEGVYSVQLRLTRLSGDISSWKRINRRFLNVVRQQFLIWRTLAESERHKYAEAEARMVEGAEPVTA